VVCGVVDREALRAAIREADGGDESWSVLFARTAWCGGAAFS